MMNTPAVLVRPKQGIALRLPQRPYTDGLHHCLAPLLYSPETRIVALAHVYDPAGPARYSADQVIDSLIEDMMAKDSGVKPTSLRAYLVGELRESIARPGSRTSKVTASLRERRIPIMHKVLGGQFWKKVCVLEHPEILVEEYLENCVQRYGEFHAEREYRLVL